MSIFFAVISPRPFESSDVLPIMVRFPSLCVDMEGSMRFVRGIYEDAHGQQIHLTWVRIQPDVKIDVADLIIYVNYPLAEIEMNDTISEIRTTFAYLSEAKETNVFAAAPDGLAFIYKNVNAASLTAAFTEHARKGIQLVK